MTSTAPPMEFGPGSIVGGYELREKLGEGGMGVVFSAVQLSLARPVALKLVAPQHATDLVFRERFRREGLVQATLDHPHIVTVYEAGDVDGIMFIAMGLVAGKTLKELVTARTLDAERTIRLLGPIADALDSAHEVGLIHRDIKPQNVLVGRRDHAYLADFGLTKSRDGASMTRTGQFVGTLDYVSPEQIRGEHATGQSDIYSLGAVLFECLTGTVPFAKESDAAVLYAHMSDPPPAPSALRPELPSELDAVVAKALAKTATERYGSAVALIDAARGALGGSANEVPPPPGRATPHQMGLRSAEAAIGTHAPQPVSVDQETAPETPVASAPDRQAAERDEVEESVGRRRWARSAAASFAVVGIGVAAYALGHNGFRPPDHGASVVGAGHVTLTMPPTWSRSAAAVPIPGLSLTDRMTLRDSRGALTVGTLVGRPADRTLLPAALVRTLGHDVGASTGVRLGQVNANRFDDITLAGIGPAVLYTAPTSTSVLVLACTGSASSRRACESIATTLTLDGASAEPLGPDPRLARELTSVVADLNHATTVSRLRDARTRTSQHDALSGLADGLSRAARRLEPERGGPGARDVAGVLQRALQQDASGFTAMARATRTGRTSGYSRARSATTRRLDETNTTLTRLARFGYGRVGR